MTKVVPAVFLFTMRVFFATLTSGVVLAGAAFLLFPGPFGDTLSIGLLTLIPSLFVIVTATTIEDHFVSQRRRPGRALRALRFAFLIFASFLLLFVALLAPTVESAGQDWQTVVFASALFSAVSTIWGVTYWFIYTLSAPIFTLTPPLQNRGN